VAPITRLVDPADAQALASLLAGNREFLAPWEPERDKEFYTAVVQRKFIEGQLAEHAVGRNLPHVILDANGEIIGRVTISNIVRGAFLSGNLGYWLGQQATGHGYATRAVTEIKRIAFTELGMHRLEAGTLVHNVRSQRVLERNGFARYGLAPRLIKIAGRWQDHILFQALNE